MSTSSLDLCYAPHMDGKQQYSPFGEWLDRQLRRRGMTRRELAELTGLSEGSIYSYLTPVTEQSARNPSPRSADQIAVALGLDPNEVREAAELPLRDTALPTGSFAYVQREGLAPARMVFVPVIGVAPAETARFAAEVGEMIPVPARHLNGVAIPKAVVVGSEVFASKGIHEGDTLLIETAGPFEPRPDQMVMLVHGDQLTGGEWVEMGEHGYVHLLAPRRELVEVEDDAIVGVVEAVLRVWRV